MEFSLREKVVDDSQLVTQPDTLSYYWLQLCCIFIENSSEFAT